MFNKKALILTAIFIVSLLAISAVSAAENATVDISAHAENDVFDLEDAGESVVGLEDQEWLGSDESGDVLTANPKTFTDLNDLINGNYNGNVYLDGNYTFVSGTDNSFKNGIVVSRSVTIHGNGFTLDGSNNARIFDVSNSNVVFMDIVFVNGKSTGNGGAIRGECTAVNCSFINNRVTGSSVDDVGGALSGGSAVNCTFIGNSAVRYGGAMYKGTATNCIFINNTAGDDGGAMTAFNGRAAVNCTFIGNTASNAGGAIRGACTAVDCYFINNTAGKSGGAKSAGSAVNCTFINNTADLNGGAIEGGSAVNCTFINNTAAVNGGAMKGFTGFSAENCIFTGNSAEEGGAMYGYKYSAVNCTFIANSAENNGGALSGNGNYSAAECSFVNNSAVKNGGAMYGASNYSARNCSFVNNSADICGAVYGACNAVNCTFINNSDNNPKTFADLNDLINGNMDRDIYLNSNYTFVSVTDDNFKEGIVINRELTVWGNGFTISGNDIARIFNVSNSNVIFRDIVFVNGKSAGDGGAINGSCTAVNCSFINNTAEKGGAMHGGCAVNCTFTNNIATKGGAISDGSAVDCSFADNSANFGGAMYNCSAENCTFISNAAEEGGAMYDSSAVNCLFEGNEVLEEGGAMHGGSAVDCWFIDNSAFSGGAMSDGSAVNCYFSGNSADLGGAMYGGTASKCIFNDNRAGSSGDDTYGTIILDKSATVIRVSDVIATYGTVETIVVGLTNDAGKPVGGAVLSVDLNGVKSFVTDSNGQVNLTTEGLPAGKYAEVITFAGDDYCLNSSARATVSINKATPDIGISAKSINYGEDLVVKVTSDDNLAYRVNVTVANQSKLLRLKEGKRSLKFSDLAAGSYTVTALYKGDANYSSVSVDTAVVVKTIVNISLSVSSGSNGIVVVNVTSDDDLAYRVNVTVANQSKLLRLKDSNGTLKFKGLEDGAYEVVALYKGDADHAAVSANASLEVKNVIPNITVSASAGGNGIVVVNVTSDDDLVNRVNVTVGNQSKLLRLKGGKGTLRFDGLADGSYSVSALYKGDADYAQVSVNASVEVNRIIPNLSVSARAYDNGIVVVNVVSDSNLANRVNVTVGNQSKLLRLKNGMGALKFTDLEVGTYNVSALYKGDGNYVTASANATVVVSEVA